MRRIEWIDVAKGLAIILIVMLHARDYALSLIPPSPEHVLRWTAIDPLFSYIRLPLFFLLSGMLASGAFSHHQGPPRYNARRALSLARVYLLWSVPLLLLIPSWPRDGWDEPVDPLRYLDLLRGGSVLWYLWATVMAFGFACVTRRWPALPTVMFAAALGAVMHILGDRLGGAMGPLGRCLPYYMLGIRYPFALLWLARWRRLTGFLMLLSAYAAALPILPRSMGMDAVREILGICMAVVGIGWATERWPRVMARFAWLGRRTLPVYIFHFPLLAFLGSAAVRNGRAFAQWPPTLWLFLPVLSGITIAISLVLFAGLRAIGLGWTFAMPLRRVGQREAFSALCAGTASR